MPEEINKIPNHNQGTKSMKIPFIIYAYTESVIEKIYECDNNSKLSTTKISKHTICGIQSIQLFIH